MQTQNEIPEVVMPQCPPRRLLAGQKVLVTGASSGIGRAVAIHLACEGADVAVNYLIGDKAAQEVIDEIKSIAQEVAPFRIRVNSVCPGAIRTPINHDAWATPEAYAELMKLIPYKRIGEPEDIARAVAWLASDDADYVHGTSLFVDGGMTLYPGFAAGG